MARVTAVVVAYWPERLDNVHRIIYDLQHGTRPPETLIVLNNNPGLTFGPTPGVHILSGWNTECRGKYVAALFAQADYYLLNDDDITVGTETLRLLAKWAHPDIVTANRGTVLKGDSFFKGSLVDADKVKHPTKVDAVHGCSLFLSHAALLRMFAAESQLRERWPTEGDDILAGLANPGHVVILPMQGAAAWKWLDDGDVGMNRAEGYYEMRDEFTKDALAAMGATST